MTHTQRYHAHYHTAGTGPVYQGRFKSSPIEAGEHLLTVCRYVERNPLRAGLVRQAEAWRWSSLWHRLQKPAPAWLAEWPEGRPATAVWLKHVHAAQTEAELEAVRRSLLRGAPFGGEAWSAQTAARLGLESTLRPRGRPRKEKPPHEE